MKRARSLRHAALLAVLVLLVPAHDALAGTEGLEEVRTATEGYRDVAAAETDGYGLPPDGPLHECISALDGSGAMGLHYINGELVSDAELAPTAPEVLVYEPDADGGLSLVALEYVVFAEAWDAENEAPPVLFGQELMFTDQPNRYELPPFYSLHAWAWKENPSGTFVGFNPDVTCPSAELPDTAVDLPPTGLPPSAIGLALALAVIGLAGAGALARRTGRWMA